MRNILILCLVTCFYMAHAQNITQIEYFINTDPGYGSGTAITDFASASNVANINAVVNLTEVSKGVHVLYLRSKDDKSKWSQTASYPFLKFDVSSAMNISKIEYFYDIDPGFDMATEIPFTPSKDMTKLSKVINITSLSVGVHVLYVRAKDASGKWSLVANSPFVMLSTPTANISQVEYFIDLDPGFGKATQVSVTPSINITNKTFAIDVESVAPGPHNLFVRTKNSNNTWSITSISTFIKTNTNGLFEFVETSAFDIYPNPNNGLLNIKLINSNKGGDFELMNASGQVIKTFSSNVGQVSLSEFPSGSYFVRYRTDGVVYYKKVMKE